MHRIIKFVFVLTIICLLLTCDVDHAKGGGGGHGGGGRGGGGSRGGRAKGGGVVTPGHGGGNGHRSSGPSIELGLLHYFTVVYLTYTSFRL